MQKIEDRSQAYQEWVEGGRREGGRFRKVTMKERLPPARGVCCCVLGAALSPENLLLLGTEPRLCEDSRAELTSLLSVDDDVSEKAALTRRSLRWRDGSGGGGGEKRQ